MTIPTDILMWLCGGVLSIIGMLLLTIRWLLGDKWKLVTEELDRSQAYRHKEAPKLFAEVHSLISATNHVNDKQDWRLDHHDGRLQDLERAK